MDVLFTPWRYPYLTSPKSENAEGCIFCKAAQSKRTRDTLTLYCSNQALVMLNRYPYTNGHLMVAPIAHEARLFDSTDASLRALIRLTAESQRILSDVYHPDGFNVGMNFGRVAGAGVADRAIVGSAGLMHRIAPGGLEIGYWVRVAHARQGIATRAVRAPTDAAFGLGWVTHVELHHDEANVASGAIPARLGFRRVDAETDRYAGPPGGGAHLRPKDLS